MSSQASYKKERAKWYAKLKKSGFEDIEANEHSLKSWSSKFVRADKTSITSWQAKQEYYYQATHFLNSHKFETNLEKAIWEYHANGISVREIASLLNKTKVIKTNRQTIWLVVKKLRSLMKTKRKVRYEQF